MKNMKNTVKLLAILFVSLFVSCSSEDDTELNNEDLKVGFVTVWDTTSANEEITIPINPDTAFTYDYTVDWGDGTLSTNVTESTVHTYAIAGSYTVEITGDFPAIYFNNSGDKDKIKNIEQWGNIKWESMRKAFAYCSNLNSTAIDTPDLSRVTDMSFMFDNCNVYNAPMNDWDVSNVTNMAYVFAGARAFNQPLNKWDVSAVTNMNSMFYVATYFNQDISGWNTANNVGCSDFYRRSSLTLENLPTLGCF